MLHIYIAAILGVILFCNWQNNAITIHRLAYQSEEVPVQFDGTRIVQISDLHNKQFGKGQEALLEKIRACAPDIIVVTGDLIDSRRTNRKTAMELIDGAVRIAPVYFVSGNHEARIEDYGEFSKELKQSGVILLDNDSVNIEKDGAQIQLIGLADPTFTTGDAENATIKQEEAMHDTLETADISSCTVLLSHRPELITTYAKYGIDLVFSGHAHGGQIRLPFFKGLYAPGQGILPTYTGGLYRVAATTMVVSRGLGNSVFPLRIFNRPEIVVLTLRHAPA